MEHHEETFEPATLGATPSSADALEEHTPPAGAPPRLRVSNWPMWVLGLVIMIDQVDQNIVRGIETPLRNDPHLHMTDFKFGLLLSAFVAVNGIISVPAGYQLPAGINGPLPPNVAPHVAAVTLFGKPSNGFLNLVDRNAPPINIGPLYAHKTLDLCTPQDPVCSSGQGFSRAAHSAYKTNGMTDQAADYAASKLGR